MKERFLREILSKAAPGVTFTFKVEDQTVVAFSPEKKVVAIHSGEVMVFGDYYPDEWWPTVTQYQKVVRGKAA